jgi:hypothetical protein
MVLPSSGFTKLRHTTDIQITAFKIRYRTKSGLAIIETGDALIKEAFRLKISLFFSRMWVIINIPVGAICRIFTGF